MQLQRLDCNPIITPQMGDIGDNINGPSLIRAPQWLKQPLGRYYLYFAHHGGDHIRLAYADELCGPWIIYSPGTLRLEQTACRGHIASPDLHVDDGRLRMYFHGPTEDGQKSFLATSTDGLNFTADTQVLGPSYFRIFQWQGAFYAIARDEHVYRAQHPEGPFERGPRLFDRMRHCAVRTVGTTLQIFYSDIGDCPEHILLTELDLTGAWPEWTISNRVSLLKPETEWEGAHLPLQVSKEGAARGPVNELRDPAIYEEADRAWLLYSIAGESGIAIAEIT